eukprot:gb/GECH01013297.1/.p1 GENE.gb/GECH01013297.1/~~gb/GECH01013297.1/.p1  ORF type:complete len:304 (+),score=57.21 gb/GECH01013297.1/:1-912(+)
MRLSTSVTAQLRNTSNVKRYSTQIQKTRTNQTTTRIRTGIIQKQQQRTYATDSQNVFSVGPGTSLDTLGILYFKHQYERLKNISSNEPFEDLRMNFENIKSVEDLNDEINEIIFKEHDDATLALKHAYAYFRRFMVSSHRNSMKKPINPNGVTFRILMRACYHVHADQCVLELMDIMKEKFALPWEHAHITALFKTSMKSGAANLIQYSLKLAVENKCAEKSWFSQGWERCKEVGKYMEAIEVLRAMNSAGERVPEEWKKEARGFLGLYRSKKLRESTEQEDKYLQEPLSENWHSLLENVHVS